jgi:hypothetical protein|tara:strand:- start:264 stop:701 length:438 start_codon:yes stop_codon:yes gene_type:complete
MVVIQCPHCNDDIELGNNDFGSFDCPHCNKEFEYESSSDNGRLNLTNKMVLALSLISIMIISSGAFLINYSFIEEELDEGNTECEYEREGLWFIPSDCTFEPGEKAESKDGAFCGGIIFLLIGFGLLITTFVARSRGRVRFENSE